MKAPTKSWCPKCQQWVTGRPWNQCSQCRQEMLLPHLPGETCGAPDCAMCCGMDVEERDQVVEEKSNAMMLLGPGPGVCPECAVDHRHDDPHNQQSLYYQMNFKLKHGRWPTWTDAMAHCDKVTKASWRLHLRTKFQDLGLDVPDDLRGDGPEARQ